MPKKKKRASKVVGKKTREAHNAQQRVQDARARGEIKKPSKCSRCGKQSSNLEFAHSGYSGRLNGKWLCRSCHHKSDKASPKGGGSGAKGTQRAGK
jgi:formylmethanofuran dehydrogenase subunit E